MAHSHPKRGVLQLLSQRLEHLFPRVRPVVHHRVRRPLTETRALPRIPVLLILGMPHRPHPTRGIMRRRRHKGLKILHPRVPDRKQHPGDRARYRHELHPQAVLIRGIQGRIHFLLRHAGRGFRRRWLRRGFGGQGCRHSGGQIHFALGLHRLARTFASKIPARHPQHQQQRQGGYHRVAAAGPRRRCGFSCEGFDELHTATETLRLLFRQTAGKDRPNRVGHPFRRLGWLADSRLPQRQLVLGLERQMPSQQLVGHHR